MRGRAAHHKYWLPRERKLPHRMIELFGDGVRPGALVQPRKLVECEPHFPVISIHRLHRPGPGKHHERCVRPERARFSHKIRKLGAENLDLERIEKQIPQLVRAVARDPEDARKGPRFAAQLSFEFREQDALPRTHRVVLADFAFSQIRTRHTVPPSFSAIYELS